MTRENQLGFWTGNTFVSLPGEDAAKVVTKLILILLLLENFSI